MNRAEGITRKRGAGWEYVLDIGAQEARRCEPCEKRYWTADLKGEQCPRCGRVLGETKRERRQISRAGFRRKQDAVSALLEVRGQVAKKTHVLPKDVTLRTLFEQWIESHALAKDLKATTVDDYRRRYWRDIDPSLGSVQVQEIVTPMLSTFVTRLRKEGGRQGQGLSPSSVHHAYVIVAAVLDFAVQHRLIVVNPAERMTPPRVPLGNATTGGIWSSRELERFLTFASADRDYALWRLAIVTGCRRGEALAAAWDRIDLETGTWRIDRNLTTLRSRPHLTTPKTDKGIRSVRLDAETLGHLRRWKKQQAEERLAAGPAWHDEGWVFTTRDGRHRHPNLVSRRFLRLVREAGLPRIRFHDLRHSAVVHMLRQGIDVKTISARVGHSTVRITLDLYAHVLDDMAQDAADRIALGFGSLASVGTEAR